MFITGLIYNLNCFTMYFPCIHLVIPILIMCVIWQCIQQLLKQLYHSCRAQDFNPVTIWIFNEGNSFHFTYKRKISISKQTTEQSQNYFRNIVSLLFWHSEYSAQYYIAPCLLSIFSAYNSLYVAPSSKSLPSSCVSVAVAHSVSLHSQSECLITFFQVRGTRIFKHEDYVT